MIPPADQTDPWNMRQLAKTLAESRYVGDDTRVMRVDVSSSFPLRLTSNHPDQPAYVVLDFGQVSAGYLTLDIQGQSGSIIDLGYSESLAGGVHETNKQQCRYCDRFILGEHRITHGPVLPKTLRYLLICVRGSALLHGVTHHVSTYPFQWRGRCFCSDPVLEAAWQIGTHTVEISTEDTYLDTPRRERAGWLGDLRPEALAAYYAFGDYRLARHSIGLFFQSQDLPGRFLEMGNDNPGWLLARYPSIDPHRMPDYNLAMIPILHEYIMHSGDVAFLDQLWPGVEKLIHHNNHYRRPDGLYEFRPYEHNHGTYNLTDWAPTDNRGAAAPIAMHYADQLRLAAQLATLAGRDALARTLADQHAQTCDAIRQKLWDESRGLFVNGLIDDKLNPRAGYHENLLALLYDIADAKQTQRIRQTVLSGDEAIPLWQPDPPYELYEQRRDGKLPQWDDSKLVSIGSPYFSFFTVWALFEAGLTIKALNTIRAQWGGILRQGATTVWEEWDGSKSRSHGWGAGPTWLLLRYALGIEVTAPGFTRVDILPSPGDLKHFTGRVPAHQGSIDADWSIKNGRMTLRVIIPQGITARIGLPAEHVREDHRLMLNGASVEGKRLSLRRGAYVFVEVALGSYVLSGC